MLMVICYESLQFDFTYIVLALALVSPLAGELGLKVGQLFGLLRLVPTGLDVAPPLFETMEVMGKERTISSIETALNSF